MAPSGVFEPRPVITTERSGASRCGSGVTSLISEKCESGVEIPTFRGPRPHLNSIPSKSPSFPGQCRRLCSCPPRKTVIPAKAGNHASFIYGEVASKEQHVCYSHLFHGSPIGVGDDEPSSRDRWFDLANS